MEGEDSPESSPGGGRSGKGKRGVIWGASETAALINIWGQAERKYALSSRKRNYEIYERIASELGKSGYKRTVEECRSKTKLLRKLYKAAARQDDNNTTTPGAAARSKFLWMEEMDQIFRRDASIHPLGTTGSGAVPRQVADTDMDSGEVFSRELYKVKDDVPNSSVASDSSLADTQMTDGGEASFSGQSAPAHPSGTQQDRGRTADVRETCSPEATLDPATRDMIRKRKQRATAAAQLDRTLTGFVDWVKQESRRKEKLLSEVYAEQKHFHDEVISNMRIASSCLQQLTEYMTA
ncbi:hypothetical protein JRQ81_000024 [Phrynocephalus forsythii]|uniref:Myb/SANT-like DNA-binding domain-containing protein n=1 Tax=Phrynocephalus forsythii TaxID=171643 RepID=A0A9Q0X568_9SAUR|nr:hypothetical protein JRQ81_000024 [Phrynocephalus forsythii]